MPKKINVPPKCEFLGPSAVPTRPKPEAPLESGHRKLPCRDTRETPAPNPDGDFIEAPKSRPPCSAHPGARDGFLFGPFKLIGS